MVDGESGELMDCWTQSGRLVDVSTNEEAGGVRHEGGVALDDGAVVGDDDATATVEV